MYVIICSLLAIFFLLYFNRLVASAVSYLIRTWTWRQYRVWIDIQALQVSLLGGRIFFTGLRYHGDNETILIQNGHITWSYWLRRVREVNLQETYKDRAHVRRSTLGGSCGSSSGDAEDPRPNNSDQLPCRINVKLAGLEWFVYNRTPLYDSILAEMTDRPSQRHVQASGADGSLNGTTNGKQMLQRYNTTSEKQDDSIFWPVKDSQQFVEMTSQSILPPGEEKNSQDEAEGKQDIPLFLDLFPIDVECIKAALVMGNENTKAILLVKTDSIRGEIDASASSGLDQYRQLFKLEFKNPLIEMRDNEDFKEEQTSKALREKGMAHGPGPLPKRIFFRHQRRKIVSKLRDLMPSWKNSVESFSQASDRTIADADRQVLGDDNWQGLARYIDEDDQDEKIRWSSVEYAAIPTILDSPEASMTIYWDVPGKVSSKAGTPTGASIHSNINGDMSPAWAIEFSLKGGTINYGPWADRHRADLQNMFFPALCKNSTPACRLPVGADRIATQFNLYVEFDKPLTLRIPIREESKNWKYKGKEYSPAKQEPSRRRFRSKSQKQGKPLGNNSHERPYGWLELKIDSNATVSYSTDMVAGTSSYTTKLNLDLPRAEISSSVNHSQLWRSGPIKVDCDLSTPLKWNELRSWSFDINASGLDFFLLRDHVFLFTDLIEDWSSGPLTEYLVFTPFQYLVNLDLRCFRLYLNVNDANIINEPTNFDDNAFLILSTSALASTLCIPLDTFRPVSTTIPFKGQADTASVGLQVPPWNTQAAFLSSSQLGHVENLVVDGKYHYNTTTSPANTDTVLLDISAQSPWANLHGFFIRYCLSLKENYFGDTIHFKTLEEYQDVIKLQDKKPSSPVPNQPPPKKSNDLDIVLSVRVDDPRVLFPENLYSTGNSIQVEMPTIALDLRFTNYYMDIALSVSPISLSLAKATGDGTTSSIASSNTQMFIDGLSIHGHRLFGLPPSEPTYLCNWDFSVGAITGDCCADFLSSLALGGRAFDFSLDDHENALISFSAAVIRDVTFLRAHFESVRLWIHTNHGDAAFQLSAGPIDVNFNDWARTHYSTRADIVIPEIQVCSVNADSAAQHKMRRHVPTETDACVHTALRVSIVGRKADFHKERALQQAAIRKHDQRTERTPFLILQGVLDNQASDVLDLPAQSVPPMPTSETRWKGLGDRSSVSTAHSPSHCKRAMQKSSFLSLRSCGTGGSVVRPRHRSIGGEQTPPQNRLVDDINSRTLTAKEPQKRVSRSNMQRRDRSASTRRHSDFYGVSDKNGAGRDTYHTSVAFSSPYFPPYFPLESVRLDTGNMETLEFEDDAEHPFNHLAFDLGEVDEDGFQDDCVYTAVIVELPSGFTSFITLSFLKSITSLISAIQPSEPEDVIDGLQLASLSSVVSLRKQKRILGKIDDFMFRLPHVNIKFVNTLPGGSAESSQDEQDQYSIMVSKLAVAARLDKSDYSPSDDQRSNTRVSFNLNLESASIAAAEKLATMDDTQAALLAEIQHVSIAMGTKEVQYIDGDIGVIRGTTSSEKIHYLASLIHRTKILVEEVERLFDSSTAAHRAMVEYFVYSVVTEAGAAADPPFLTRPSAVLRSAGEHLRTADSWKLISRLRQLWRSLSPEDKEQLHIRFKSGAFAIPEGARDRVVSSFQRWRGWDLEDPGSCLLLKTVFGSGEKNLRTGFKKLALGAVLKLANVELILDPGPKQNEIRIREIATRVETKDSPAIPSAHDPGVPQRDVGCPIIQVNVCCGEASVSLNWELCELAQGILKLRESFPSPRAPVIPSNPPSPVSTPGSVSRRATHIVLALGHGTLDIETINLHAKSDWKDIKSSLLLSRGGQEADMSNVVLSCDSMRFKIRSHAQPLARVDIMAPSVFASHELEGGQAVYSHIVKSTASCRGLAILVRQDPIALLEVADLLVKDEASQLYQLKHQLPSSPQEKPKPRNQRIAETLSSVRSDLAMFIEGYSISIPLLQSLTYMISSENVARASVAAQFGKETIFNFDIQKNHHKMLIDVKSEPRVISVLEIPPTNGRITSHIENGENSVSVTASVMLVTLDASEVYSLLTALNRPEIGNAISDVQEQAGLVQAHAFKAFGLEEAPEELLPQPAEAETVELLYSAHLTFEGLEIFGNTPLKSESDPVAKLSFCLGKVHMGISNRTDPHGPSLQYPELHVVLKQISFEILKGTKEDLRSCGNVCFGALVTANSLVAEDGITERTFKFDSGAFEVNFSPDTIATTVDVLGYFGDKIKDIDTSKELEYFRRLRQPKPRVEVDDGGEKQELDIIDSFLSSFVYIFEVRNIQLCWLASGAAGQDTVGREDLVLGLKRVAFTTRRKKTAKLTIQNLQLQMVPPNHDKDMRSTNSALLPEVIFNIAYFSTPDGRRFAFQAVGKSLDLRLTSGFIIPASNLGDSIGLSAKNVQQAYEHWSPAVMGEKPVDKPPRPFFAKKRLESLLVDADFAGAVVHLSGKRHEHGAAGSSSRGGRANMAGKYGQFNPDDSGSSTVLRSPGLALKMEFRDNGKEDPSLYAEVKVDASSNIIYPSVVPLIMEISSSIKQVVSDGQEEKKPAEPDMVQTKSDEEKLLTADPAAVIGRLKLNIGLRICRQEFSLSCQPIARVQATALFDDIYLTVNTVWSAEQGNFFAISAAFSGLRTSVQHVYSRESTGSFEVESIVLSLMNSKHVSGTSGVSAILKVSPANVSINAKQLHDFLLFREIWVPAEIGRPATAAAVPKLPEDTSQAHLVQRYQQVAATAAFPWTATISVAALQVSVSLGQALGRSTFVIEEFWVSSKKTSDWEQNLCLGFEKIGIDSAGRMSGFVSLRDFKLRTAIQWPQRQRALNETPLVQASLAFSQFRVKAAFDYQAFLVADITSMEFLMYNIRRRREGSGDRLVATFDGEAVNIFGTSTSAAQGVALWQAIRRLIQERKTNLETSLREMEKFVKRRRLSSWPSTIKTAQPKLPEEDTMSKSPISLDTDVVVTLKALNLGVFPSTLPDRQVFKMEALGAQLRFAASIEERQIHSTLGVTLGQLRIGLAGVGSAEGPKAASEISVEDVVSSATGSLGGTILKVPKVEAVMQTWQRPSSTHIDYMFKSSLSGKVEVGWNYSRISYIKGMWANHSKSLEQTWGKEIQPLTAIKVTGVTEKEDQEQQKITAEVKVPQSKYEYRALEPPIIETPQLRDMGEATPPLEWIGLHRDRLPNLTHQIVIVTLLELAGEVEDAYSQILGS